MKQENKSLPPAFLDSLEKRFTGTFSLSQAVRERHGGGEGYYPPQAPDAVLFARNEADVMDAVRLCHDSLVPVIAYGAGTSVEDQLQATRGGLSIDLSGMNRILDVRPGDLDCTVEAGVTRLQLNSYLRDTGLFFPIDPGADATLGGMAATGASGTNAVRYGTMRENVLGLKAVTAAGEVIRTGTRARKSSAGYDLTRLLIGSEGTLAIITELHLRLYGIPETMRAAVCAFGDLKGAVDTVIAIIQTGIPIARIELLDDVMMQAVSQYSKLDYPASQTLFFEFHGSPRSVQEQVELSENIALEKGGRDFQWAARAEDRNRLWQARHDAAYAAKALRPGGLFWSTDVCVPISRLAECILETKEDLRKSPVPAPIVGHVGDGNFHVLFVLDPENPDELRTAKQLNERLVARAIAMDGTSTGEHGVGLAKRRALQDQFDPATLGVMRRLKEALDPAAILNPDKILFNG